MKEVVVKHPVESCAVAFLIGFTFGALHHYFGL